MHSGDGVCSGYIPRNKPIQPSRRLDANGGTKGCENAGPYLVHRPRQPSGERDGHHVSLGSQVSRLGRRDPRALTRMYHRMISPNNLLEPDLRKDCRDGRQPCANHHTDGTCTAVSVLGACTSWPPPPPSQSLPSRVTPNDGKARGKEARGSSSVSHQAQPNQTTNRPPPRAYPGFI